VGSVGAGPVDDAVPSGPVAAAGRVLPDRDALHAPSTRDATASTATAVVVRMSARDIVTPRSAEPPSPARAVYRRARRPPDQAGPTSPATIAADSPTSGMPPPGCEDPPTRNSPGTGDRFAGRRNAARAPLLLVP